MTAEIRLSAQRVIRAGDLVRVRPSKPGRQDGYETIASSVHPDADPPYVQVREPRNGATRCLRIERIERLVSSGHMIGKRAQISVTGSDRRWTLTITIDSEEYAHTETGRMRRDTIARGRQLAVEHGCIGATINGRLVDLRDETDDES